MHDQLAIKALELHRQRFGKPAVMFAAPGRANLIGEHTDYSEGFVMPAAIDFSTVAAMSAREDSRAVMYSANFDEVVEHSTSRVTAGRRNHWTDYPAGVLWSLKKEGLNFPGFNLTVAGDVPVGAGLSSSASIEVSVAMALLAISNQHLELKRVAQVCQRAENGFVGANSGIMDQLVVCCGKPDHALMIDCRTLEFRLVKIPSHVGIVLCNSMVQHSISGGEYNARRAEIEAGVKVLRRHNPSIKFLRDATMNDLNTHKGEMPDNVFRRCRHVITENQRVLDGAAAFESGDLKQFGELMKQSHDSYRYDFEASCEECDILVELAQKQPGCYGARLTGGGFGGCTVNLVEEKDITTFVDAMREGYKQSTGITAEIYQSKASDGVHRVDF
jgi:galactokinase